MELPLHHARIAAAGTWHLLRWFGNSSPARLTHDVLRAARLLRRDPAALALSRQWW